ncbi:hypothetical protein PCANC_25961 [Puccinia coronata f. sp. avenae]|uniref:Uncharacterized protein n=1 Tax=Puccinia coronata f. sp. avenae TaxID=200324 RepID=A0A2N5THG4_9BASI|nr:hypothetical protein PCANC_25961 [Puccinia coronata f. sp. avenae]
MTMTTVAATTTLTTMAAAMVTGRFLPGATFGMGAGRLAMVQMDSDMLSSPSSSPTVPLRRYHHHPHQQQHLHQLPAPSSKSFESDSQLPKQAPVSPTRTRLNTLIARASPQAHLPPDPPTIPTAPLFAAGYSHPQHPHPHSYQQQQQQQQQSGLCDSPRSLRPAPSATALAQNQTHMLHHHLHMLHRHHSLRTHHPDPRNNPRSSPSLSPAHVN